MGGDDHLIAAELPCCLSISDRSKLKRMCDVDWGDKEEGGACDRDE